MVFIAMFLFVSESAIPSFWLNECNFVMYSYVLKVQQGHSCSHRTAAELTSDLIFYCCCLWSVCVCRQRFCNMQDGLLRGKQQYHGKKKLSQAHAMLDPKESKFDKSSSLVVLPVAIAFFFW